MITLKQRLKSIKVLEDIDKQIALAQQHVATLRTKAKGKKTLKEKLEALEYIKIAERTSQFLRMHFFDIEDLLLRGEKPAALLPA